MTINGEMGKYWIEGRSYDIWDIIPFRGDENIEVTFCCSGPMGKGSGYWILNDSVSQMDGSWTQDGQNSVPWPWTCSRVVVKPNEVPLAGGSASASPVVVFDPGPPLPLLDREWQQLRGPLDDLDTLRKAYAKRKVGQDRPVW